MPLTQWGEKARELVIAKGVCGSREELGQMLEAHPDDVDARAFSALALFRSGRGKEAEKVILFWPTPAAGLLAIQAEMELIQSNCLVAEKLIEQALALDPEHYLAINALITYQMQTGQMKEAETNAQLLVSLFPEDPTAYYLLTSILQQSTSTDEHERLLDTSPEWFQTTPYYHYGRAVLAITRRQVLVAERHFQIAVDMLPGSDDAWAYLARCQIGNGNATEAERSAQIALELNSENTVALTVMQKICSDKGDRRAASEYEKRRTSADPSSSGFVEIGKANDLVRNGKLGAALQVLERLSKSDQRYVATTARAVSLTYLMQNNRWGPARKKIEEIESRGESKPIVQMSLAEILFHEGKITESVELAKNLLIKDENQSNLFPGAMRIFVKTKSDVEVEWLLRLLMRDENANPDVQSTCIYTLDTLNRKDQARLLFNSSINRFPEHKELKCIAIRFAAADRDYHTACRLSKELPPNVILRLSFWVKFRIWLASKVSG